MKCSWQIFFVGTLANSAWKYHPAFSHHAFSTRKRLFTARHKLTTTVDTHAAALRVALLATVQSWNWPPVKYIQESGDESITPKLLSCFIEASQAYPDSQLVDQFWFNVQRGHASLKTNNGLTAVPAMNQRTILNIGILSQLKGLRPVSHSRQRHSKFYFKGLIQRKSICHPSTTFRPTS